MIHHALAGSHVDVGVGVAGTVAALRGRFDGGEVIIIGVALRLNRFFLTFVARWAPQISFIQLITESLAVIPLPEKLG